MQPRPSRCAMGLDTGTTNTGIAIVTDRDVVLYVDVLSPPAGLEITAKLWWFHRALKSFVLQYEPIVIGIETYCAPTVKVRAMSSKAIAQHNWLIGVCATLAHATSPGPVISLLEATDWQHAITGIPVRLPIGGKGIIQEAVERRTGFTFTKNSGFHRSDAAGLALVSLDNFTMVEYAKHERQSV